MPGFQIMSGKCLQNTALNMEGMKASYNVFSEYSSGHKGAA